MLPYHGHAHACAHTRQPIHTQRARAAAMVQEFQLDPVSMKWHTLCACAPCRCSEHLILPRVTTHPQRNTLVEEPFSTSAQKILTLVLATVTKIRTNGISIKSHNLHLLPRIAPPDRSRGRAARPRCRHAFLQTTRSSAFRVVDKYGSATRPLQAPSIFGATLFGRLVVTHYLAGADFHGHGPAV